MADYHGGKLPSTFQRAGISPESPQAISITEALDVAQSKLSIPPELVRLTPTVSAHKQQRLLEELQRIINNEGPKAAQRLVPLHPRDPGAYDSYCTVLELCHKHILGIDGTKGLHRFHALLARRWMLGHPLPQMIEDQIKRSNGRNTRAVIRDTLDLIEREIRFQAVRLFGCYNSILSYVLVNTGLPELAASIPSVPLYLEVGASDRTMISFIALGLSRVTAMRLNELSANKNMDTETARQWLRRQSLETLGLSPLLAEEVKLLLKSS